MEEEKRLQCSAEHHVQAEYNVDLKPSNITANSLLSAEHDVQAEYNVDLEPVNITANSVQPHIIVLSTNSSMADPNIAVTAGPSGVRNHKGVQPLLILIKLYHEYKICNYK